LLLLSICGKKAWNVVELAEKSDIGGKEKKQTAICVASPISVAKVRIYHLGS
jgi:hypothetical protein